MERFIKFIVSGIIFFLSTSLFAATPYYGLRFSYVLIPKEPPHLKGYQLMLTYDPGRFNWYRLNLYFDGGFSHFWDTQTINYSTVNIYSIAPVVRYYCTKLGPLNPFFELSLGLAYLNHTRFEKRKLGIHFSFQDRAGIGFLFGNKEQFSLGLHVVHYSNAHLSSHNSGITAPLVLDLGYSFK